MTAVWRAFFVTSTFLLAFLGLSVPFIDAGTGTFAVAVASFAMLGVMFVGSSVFIYLDWDPFEELYA
ncbi:hypothetical protein [Halogeometricum luteum]|uniref:Uncharacterized protein n=1 Tax=Halogeometricum luteum TaxID=2950537 RepID=A0ABU2G4A0_9EURY|nr:hypothetical protein [Halogeometricum sp. S3BR5-2]MDS0294953.1 hypothetical protein [Halogeometricum sp. S3BR5-2]